MVLLQGLCYVVDITMVFLTFIGIFNSTGIRIAVGFIIIKLNPVKVYTEGIDVTIHSSVYAMVHVMPNQRDF